MDIESTVEPEERHRGIYQVMLYSAEIRISGEFDTIPLQQLKIDPAQVLWNEAYVCMSLADSKGLKEEIKLQWNDSAVTLNPSLVDNGVMKEGFIAPVTAAADRPSSFFFHDQNKWIRTIVVYTGWKGYDSETVVHLA